MPYIPEFAREQIAAGAKPISAGELNYMITMCIVKYLASHELNYATINDIVGALEGAKLEFYTRIARPYEDVKIHTNGDVYGL